MHLLFIISQNLSSAVQVLTTVREIDYQLNRAYITLVLLQCIGDVFCEARSRDVNSSEKTTKTTLASSSLAPLERFMMMLMMTSVEAFQQQQ